MKWMDGEKETRQTSLHFEGKMVLFNDSNGLTCERTSNRLHFEVNCVQMASIRSQNGQIWLQFEVKLATPI